MIKQQIKYEMASSVITKTRTNIRGGLELTAQFAEKNLEMFKEDFEFKVKKSDIIKCMEGLQIATCRIIIRDKDGNTVLDVLDSDGRDIKRKLTSSMILGKEEDFKEIHLVCRLFLEEIYKHEEDIAIKISKKEAAPVKIESGTEGITKIESLVLPLEYWKNF